MFLYKIQNIHNKKPCGEPQGWDEKLYIRQSIEWYNIYTVIF